MIDAGNDQGVTPLAWAAAGEFYTRGKKTDTECLKILLKGKASVTQVDIVRRWTPLHFAAAANNVEAVKEILVNLAKEG